MHKRFAFFLAILALVVNGFIAAPSTVHAQQPGCPPAQKSTYYERTTKIFRGPTIMHEWFNNGVPSWGQPQVKTAVDAGITIEIFEMLGESWEYANNQACAYNLQFEFRNAPQLPVVTVDQLVREKLARIIVGSPSAPAPQPGPQAPTPSVSDEVGCPAAQEFTFEKPTNLVVRGPGIGQWWWSNGKPSFGQTQVKVLVNLDESVAILDFMGKLWLYAKTQACQDIMPQEISNAPQMPRVHVSQLVAEGLAFQ